MTSNAPTPEASYVVYLPDSPIATPYAITVKSGTRIQDLLTEICRYLAHPDFSELWRVRLFKCGTLDTEPPDCRDPAGERYKAAIKWLRVENNMKKMRMNPVLPLKKYFPFGSASFEGNKIDVIVVVVPRPTMAGPDHLIQSQVINVPFSDLVTFLIDRESDTATTLSWGTVVDKNKYAKKSDLPPFIKVVVERPRRADHNEKNSAAQLLRYIETKCNAVIPAIDATAVLPKLCGNRDTAIPYARGHPELFHYAAAFHYVNRRIIGKAPGAAVGDRLEFNEAYGLVFSFFQDYWEGEVANPSCTFGKQLPFPLIAREHVGVGFGVEDERALNYRKYQPQPDVAFLKGKCPRFLAQIDSLDNHYDKYRLYIQMACALKFALAFRPNPGKDDNFFLMGAFFAKEWEIHRVFFYNQAGETCFNERTYRMYDASELMMFLYEFYNYAQHVKGDDTVADLTETIAILVEGIKKANFDSLYSKKRKRTSANADSDNTNDDQTQDINTHTAMTVALQESHFQVQYLEEGFEPLHKLPDHVMEVVRPDGKLVIAKLPRKHSDELSLLRELSSQKSPHNHVIPLLDTIPSSLGQLIILPFATSLSMYSIPSLFRGSFGGICVQMSRELVEGIAFLHRRKIAHLDIKPDNLVYAPDSKRLYIIDFDLAVRCKDVDEMVEMSCGTPGWSAPEIDHDDSRPLSVFSPIRADLWSCGAVLCLFSENGEKKDMDIVRLATLLMDNEPRRRPLLHEVVDEEADFWTSGRLVQALDSRLCDGKGQEMVADGDGGLKRAHDDSDQSSRLGSVSKVPRKDGDAAVLTPLAASSSSSPRSSSDPLPDPAV